MIEFVERKSLLIRHSGRSSDFITPSFGFGCLYKCAYCYMRRHKPEGVTIAKNTKNIVQAIINHHEKQGLKIPNQTHPTKWSYDISCNEDFSLHWKYHESKFILDELIANNIFPTFATKCVNKKILDYNPQYNARIRFSLMPQELSFILEPNTSLISERIKAINTFYEAGWDVHINFSPVIVNKKSKELYKNLFLEINEIVKQEIKPFIKCEVIFLTHNEKMHLYNLSENSKAEDLIWVPEKQEVKQSSYGGANMRYKWQQKQKYVNQFKVLHNSIIPWNTIRYIF